MLCKVTHAFHMLLTTIGSLTPGSGASWYCTCVASFPGLPTIQFLQHAKTKAKGPVHFIMWMTSVST